MNRPDLTASGNGLEDICVVTVAHGRHQHLLRQREALQALHPGVAQVVVAMDDARIPRLLADGPDTTVVTIDREDGRLPLAAARNRGVQVAMDVYGPELLVLLDVDCLLGPGALSAYRAAAQRVPHALMSGPVTYLPEGLLPDPHHLPTARAPHPVRPDPATGTVIRNGDHRLFWSLNFAVRPTTWMRIGGFCALYSGYGGEDTDFAWVARRIGIEHVWVGGADAYHQYHPVSRPPVEHTVDIVRNARLFHQRWGELPMMGWLTQLADRGHIVWRDGLPEVAQPPSGPIGYQRESGLFSP